MNEEGAVSFFRIWNRGMASALSHREFEQSNDSPMVWYFLRCCRHGLFIIGE